MVSFGLGKKKKVFFWTCHDCGTKKNSVCFFFQCDFVL